MGLIRLLLAFTVMLSHNRLYAYPLIHIGDNELAVKLFFMISGFLMSLVLNGNPAYRDLRTFYVSRALRLYPIYWTMALVTVAWWAISGNGPAFVASLDPSAQVLLAVSNVVIFGQDAVMFLRPTTSGLAFTPDFTLSEPQLWRGLLVPPAWSLSLELTFYLIAPFILRRMRAVIALAVLSGTCSLVGFYLGFTEGPFSYRFFPYELSLFLVGALAERFLLSYAQRSPVAVRWSAVAMAALLCLYPHLDWPPLLKTQTYLAIFALSIPFLAVFNDQHRWDKWLGNLSYPIYIGHYLPMRVANDMPFDFAHPLRTLIVGVMLSIATALALFYGVDRPIEVRRKRLRGRDAPLDVSAPVQQ